jgi:hypothetical protein
MTKFLLGVSVGYIFREQIGELLDKLRFEELSVNVDQTPSEPPTEQMPPINRP